MPSKDEILYARTGDGIVVIKPVGGGNMAVAPCLRKIQAEVAGQDGVRYVIDMSECTTLDSTFMGTLASMAMAQKTQTGQSLVVVNAGELPQRQMKMLGLDYMLRILPEDETASAPAPAVEFRKADSCPVDDVERIVQMIESHQALIDVDSGNEVKFRGVLDHLEESLKRAEGQE